MPGHLPGPVPSSSEPWLLALVAVGVTCWAYWDVLAELAGRWSREPEYSHGFFVPVVSIVLLWMRRSTVAGQPWVGSWWGLAFLGLGVGMRLVAAYGFYTLVNAVALLPTLAGIVVLAGGWRALRWAWPSVLFLVFMIPLPGVISDRMAHPLQFIATTASTYVLQLFSIPAVAEGNVILLTDGKIGVVEACSGLRMLILFFAVSTAVALMVKRAAWERVLLVASAVPIALLVNIIRITATGFIHELIGPEVADKFFHDVGGLIMGPMALGFLWLEILFLDRAFIAPSHRPLVLRSARA